VNGQIALAPSYGPSEARRLTDEVKRDAQALWRKLIELYEGGAHTALNYPSWHEYCQAEFGFGRRHSYRLLEAGRVAERVPHGTLNERQARELAPLLRDEDEDAVVEVWHELRDEYGEELTAEKVRTAVERRLRPKPPNVTVLPAARSEVDRIARAREVLSRACEDAARLVAEWLEENPGEDRERVCRQIAPSSWQALEARVRRRQGAP
jgi:hypothetical protein